MPATRNQIQNIERFYFKIQEICEREGYAWKPVLSEVEAVEASHRKFSSGPWGVSKPVAMKARIVISFFNLLSGEQQMPASVRDILSYGVLDCCIAALIIKYRKELLNTVNPISDTAALHVMLTFLNNNKFLELVRK